MESTKDDMLILPSQLTHEYLGNIMPFNSGWLDDGEGIPCTSSVAAANLLYLVHMVGNPVLPKVYAN